MSVSQPLEKTDGTRVTPKRNWRLFAMIVLAGVTLAAALFGMRYLPEEYQRLIFAIGAGGVIAGFLAQVCPFDLRGMIGLAAGLIAFTTFVVTNANDLLVGWIVCGASALTAIVVLALYLSDPLPLDP